MRHNKVGIEESVDLETGTLEDVMPFPPRIPSLIYFNRSFAIPVPEGLALRSADYSPIDGMTKDQIVSIDRKDVWRTRKFFTPL